MRERAGVRRRSARPPARVSRREGRGQRSRRAGVARCGTRNTVLGEYLTGLGLPHVHRVDLSVRLEAGELHRVTFCVILPAQGRGSKLRPSSPVQFGKKSPKLFTSRICGSPVRRSKARSIPSAAIVKICEIRRHISRPSAQFRCEINRRHNAGSAR